MFRRLRKPITTKQTMKIVYLLNKTKKFLAIIGMLGIIWSSGPMQYLNAMSNQNETQEIVLTDDIEVTDGVNYPTTTDSDFDSSQVAILQEVVSERTANTKTFLKIDGTYEVAYYDTNVHYFYNGSWLDIDNSLLSTTDDLENISNIFKVSFPKKLDDNKDVKLTYGEYKIKWSVGDINLSQVQDKKNVNITASNPQELLNVRQEVLYENVQENVSLEYILLGTQVKENIILENYVESFNMTFEYKLKNLELYEDTDGNISFINEFGEVIFTFNDFVMFDKDLNESFDINYEILQVNDDTWSVKVIPNDEWLKNAVYPVKIDPSIILESNNVNIRDKYVYGTSGQNSTTSYIKSGYNGTYKYRSYIEIAIDSLPSDVMIDYAHLKLGL